VKFVKNKSGKTILKVEPLIEVTSPGLSIIHSDNIKTKKDLKKVFETGKKIWEARAKSRGDLADPPPEKANRLPGLLCTNCEAFIYSSYRHDFKVCKCFELTQGTQMIAIDGGFDYCKITGNGNDMVHAELDVNTWKVYAEPYKKGVIKVKARFKNLIPEV